MPKNSIYETLSVGQSSRVNMVCIWQSMLFPKQLFDLFSVFDYFVFNMWNYKSGVYIYAIFIAMNNNIMKLKSCNQVLFIFILFWTIDMVQWFVETGGYLLNSFVHFEQERWLLEFLCCQLICVKIYMMYVLLWLCHVDTKVNPLKRDLWWLSCARWNL